MANALPVIQNLLAAMGAVPRREDDDAVVIQKRAVTHRADQARIVAGLAPGGPHDQAHRRQGHNDGDRHGRLDPQRGTVAAVEQLEQQPDGHEDQRPESEHAADPHEMADHVAAERLPELPVAGHIAPAAMVPRPEPLP